MSRPDPIIFACVKHVWLSFCQRYLLKSKRVCCYYIGLKTFLFNLQQLFVPIIILFSFLSSLHLLLLVFRRYGPSTHISYSISFTCPIHFPLIQPEVQLLSLPSTLLSSRDSYSDHARKQLLSSVQCFLHCITVLFDYLQIVYIILPSSDHTLCWVFTFDSSITMTNGNELKALLRPKAEAGVDLATLIQLLFPAPG